MSKPKDQLRNKLFTIRVSPEEFNRIQEIKKKNKISIANIFRDNIAFIELFYKTTNEK